MERSEGLDNLLGCLEMRDYAGSDLWLKRSKSAAEKYYSEYVLVLCCIMLVQIKLSDENLFHFVEYQN